MVNCIVWEVTLRCNAKCLHCGSSAGLRRDNELNTDEMLSVCDQIAEIGCKNVNLLGGELFLRQDWQKLILKLRELDINVSIVTNGICLNSEVIDFLNQQQILSLGISLDGGLAATNDHIRGVPNLYERIFRTIDDNDCQFNLCAITTLNKLNIFELPYMLKNLVDSKFSVWEVQIASSHGRMLKELTLSDFEYYFASVFLAQARCRIPSTDLAIAGNHDFGYFSQFIPRHSIFDVWNGCPAGIGTIGIRSDGRVQGCLSMDDKAFSEISLKEKRLKEILSSDNFCSWYKDKTDNLKGFCKECIHAEKCKAGCSDTAYCKTGNLGENTQCHHYIEEYYLNKTAENDDERLFKKIIAGHFGITGKIYLDDGRLLTSGILTQFDISESMKKLLKLVHIGEENESLYSTIRDTGVDASLQL